jgi:hypothetical protein
MIYESNTHHFTQPNGITAIAKAHFQTQYLLRSDYVVSLQVGGDNIGVVNFL